MGVISGEGDGVLVEHFVLFWFSRCDSEVASLVASRRGASATAAALVSREHPVLGGGTCAHAVRVRARLLAGRRALAAARSPREHDGPRARETPRAIRCEKRLPHRTEDRLHCFPVGSNGQWATWLNMVRARCQIWCERLWG